MDVGYPLRGGSFIIRVKDYLGGLDYGVVTGMLEKSGSFLRDICKMESTDLARDCEEWLIGLSN